MSGEILASDKLQDYNSFENGTVISPKSFKGFKKKGDEWTVTLPPFSVVVLEVK